MSIEMQSSIESLIKTNPGIFQHLNADQMTLTVCKIAVDLNVKNLVCVPIIHRQEILKHIMSKNIHVNLLDLCNENEITEEIYKYAIFADPSILLNNHNWYFKSKFMTEKFAHDIIKEKPELLKYIKSYHVGSLPIEFKLDLIRKNPDALGDFDRIYRWKDMCELATNLNPKTMVYVSDQFLTKEMCDNAFAADPMLCRYIPEKFTNKEQLDVILSKKIEIPKSYMNLLRKHYFTLFYILYPLKLSELSTEELTYDILASVVEQKGACVLKKLNLNHLTLEEWCKLININMNVFGKTPNYVRKQIILTGVKSVLQN